MEKPKPDLQTFLTNFEEQFDEVENGSLSGDTLFRDLAEWSSMQALIVVTSFDWNYGITLNAEEIRSAQSLSDLHQVVIKKMG